MRAEIVAVGTEILLGQIVNGNAREISERLAAIGVDVHHHQVVGDNVERIAEAFRLALSRADVVVVTGGLGPTGDDVTREGLSAALGLPLRREAEIEAFLRARFATLGRDMPSSNLRQADVPAGGRFILPERGTAPGLVVVAAGGQRVYAVPGVPAEMREMLEGTILPELRAMAGELTTVSRIVKTVGLAEASVGERLADLFEELDNPTVAYLASGGEVRVRLTAKAPSEERARAVIEPVEREVRARLGDAVFGADDDTLEGVVARLLVAQGLTAASAESLTGGGLAARMTAAPGASQYFRGAVVAYTVEAKRGLLGVSEATIASVGTVSEACAVEMAAGARRVFGADVGVALTGVAGPEPLEGHPPGTVWVGLAWDGAERAVRLAAPGDRAQVVRIAQQAGLNALRKHLLRRAATTAARPDGGSPADGS